MKKSFILLLLIIIAGVFITGCPMESISYCPYCASRNIEKTDTDVYKCNNEKCGKTFGAKKLVD
jgi:pyruvate-formate lyase-activating enzyme